MPKAEETPVQSVPAEEKVKEPKAPKPDKVVDNVENAKKFKAKWTERKGSDGKARVNLPGTNRSVEMSHVEVADNVVSVWTSTDKSLAPDYVIVNGPTEVLNTNGIMIEDPLTAIAIAIDGATK